MLPNLSEVSSPMNLIRIHAYEVSPQRLSPTGAPPRGGAFTADLPFKKSLETFLKESQLMKQPLVDFRVAHRADASSGSSVSTHEVRTLVLDYTFGKPSTAKSAAISLATRLGKSMDDRSPFTLMMLAAYSNGDSRRLIIWAFPKDEPFHFSVSGDRARIKILQDAFSRSSSFKKAAIFEGTNSPTTFWSGRVIDKQAQHGFGAAADYWVRTFLDSRFALTGKAGTRLLTKCLRDTYEAMSDQGDRDQISNAIVAMHASQRRQWSLSRFANEYLTGTAKQMFIKSTPEESRTTTFSLQKDEFEQKLSFRIFRLQDNVMVSAPFGAIGKSVRLEDGVQRKLTCEGIVVGERVRAKYA